MRPTIFDYLPEADASAICKLAEEESPSKKRIKAVLKGVAGMGLGTLAGAGAAHYIDKAHQHFRGKPLSPSMLVSATPILGAGLGLAYNLAQAQQQKEMTRAGEDPDNSSGRSVP